MRLHFESELKKPSGSAQSAAYQHSKLWDKRSRESHRSGLGNMIERFRCFERPSNGGTVLGRGSGVDISEEYWPKRWRSPRRSIKASNSAIALWMKSSNQIV